LIQNLSIQTFLRFTLLALYAYADLQTFLVLQYVIYNFGSNSLVMASYVYANKHLLRNVRVIEIGAGTGTTQHLA
jgi:tRNA1(Val) A37 N6-methylase TrmN6